MENKKLIVNEKRYADEKSAAGVVYDIDISNLTKASHALPVGKHIITDGDLMADVTVKEKEILLNLLSDKMNEEIKKSFRDILLLGQSTMSIAFDGEPCFINKKDWDKLQEWYKNRGHGE